MSYATRQVVDVTTAADGSATAYTGNVTGAVRLVKYVKTDFTDGVDFTITSETTGQNIWTDTNINASESISPRQPTHAADGTASLYAAGGEPVEGDIVLADERIKIVIAAGGNAKTGQFIFVVA